MNMRFVMPAVFAVATLTASSVQAQYPGNTNRSCSLVALTGVFGFECLGFNSGNELGGSAEQRLQQELSLFTLLGSGGDYYANRIQDLESVTDGVVNFAEPLFGRTVVGLHIGADAGIFAAIDGFPDYDGIDGGTAYFVFDAGFEGLDSFEFFAGPGQAPSRATLFSTSELACDPVPGVPLCLVPEPASSSLLFFGLAGLAGSGIAARRRRRA